MILRLSKQKDYKMKATKIILSLTVIGTLTLGFAATDVTIDAQIQAIQSAPAGERVELMNEFKTQLSNMNAEDRSAAITQMREKMQAQMQEHGGSGEMNHEQMQEHRTEMQERGAQMQEHASEMQMEHSQEMNRMQNMNQQQAGSQFGHKNTMSGGSSNMQNMPSNEGMFGGRH